MQDSQNGLKLASASPEQAAATSFFGATTVSQNEEAAAVDSPPTGATEKGAGGLALAATTAEAKASGGLAVRAAPQPPPVAVSPSPPSASESGSQTATKPWPPPPKKSAAPPPIPVQSAVVRAPVEQARGGHGKLWLGLLMGLVLLVGAIFGMVRFGLPMLMQRFVEEVEGEWIAMPTMPSLPTVQAAAQPWPYIEVNGVHGVGETGRAILSGEVVPVGKRSREGVEVVEVESGRVLLRFGGVERIILVGDRTY